MSSEMKSRRKRTVAARALALVAAAAMFVGASMPALAAPATSPSAAQLPTRPSIPMTKLTGISSYNPVALTAWGSSLMLSYVATSTQLYITSSRDGVNFSTPFYLNQYAIGGPALCLFQSKLFIVWTGTDHHMNIGYYVSGNHLIQGKVANQPVTLSATSNLTVGCTVDTSGHLWIGWATYSQYADQNTVHLLSSTDGLTWLEGNTFNETATSSDGVTMTTDALGRILVALPLQVDIFNPNNPHVLANCVALGGQTSAYDTLGVTSEGGYTWVISADDSYYYTGQVHVQFYSPTSCTLVGSVNPTNTTTAGHGLAAAAWGSNVYYGWVGQDGASTVNIGID